MMVILALLSFLIGALLELRWNVFVLFLVLGVALPVVALIGIANGEGAGSIAVDMVVAIICIEVGYMARLIVSVLVNVTRVAIVNMMRPSYPPPGPGCSPTRRIS